MTEIRRLTDIQRTEETRMKLQYGVNETDSWRHFALGPDRECIWARLRDIDTRIIRVFLYDKFAPDPLNDWQMFAYYIQAVLNVGAKPMITFAKFRRPFSDPRAVRWFTNCCSDVVWGCIEQWGGDVVKDWYWCLWNEPNNTWIGGGLSFEQYCDIYQELALKIQGLLCSHLNGARLPLGGPSVDGFQPFWMDWIWRFVNEIDTKNIGFVNWHRYSEWRDSGETGAPENPQLHRSLVISQTGEYELRSRAVTDVLSESGIMNVCGEWNAHSHYLPDVRARFNQSIFGAAYAASVLLKLIKGGADAEMFWTGTDYDFGYGLMNSEGIPTPVYYAKLLFAKYIPFGDWVSFPVKDQPAADLEMVFSRSDDGNKCILLVHLTHEKVAYSISELDSFLSDCSKILKIDEGTGNKIVTEEYTGNVSFEGYGIAVLTTRFLQE